jgi:E3 ubiquitin-protein ligase RGLG
MGCSASTQPTDTPFPHLASSAELLSYLARDGLESAQLVVGIDFSTPDFPPEESSNWACHEILGFIAQTLRAFAPALTGGRLAAYGFGDESTQNQHVFSFHEGNRACHSEADLLQRYDEIVKEATPSTNTSFVPMVREVLYGVPRRGRFHVMVLATRSDLQDDALADFKYILDEAAVCALSVITIGIGPGNWAKLRSIKKNNYNFVQLDDTTIKRHDDKEILQLAYRALSKLPRQCRNAKEQGTLGWECLMHDVPKPLPPPDRVGKDTSSGISVSTCTTQASSASTSQNSYRSMASSHSRLSRQSSHYLF